MENNKSKDVEVKEISENSSQIKKNKNGLSLDYFLNSIPQLPLNLAIMILLCNIFFPSSGTFFMACIDDSEEPKSRKIQFIIAFLQHYLTQEQGGK